LPCIGADKQLIGYLPGTMQELCRIKMPCKESSLAYCPRGMTSSGTHTLLLGTDVSVGVGVGRVRL